MYLSIIICTHNRSNSLSTVLDCLTKQSPTSSFSSEILIIDNNSSDNTKDVVSNYTKKSSIEIRYIFEPKQGKNRALNTAIKKAKGTIFSFTDDDVVDIPNDWIKNIIESTVKYDEIGFGGRVLSVNNSLLPSWVTTQGKYRICDGVVVEHDHGNRTFIYPKNTSSPPIGANMFFRKEAFTKYGLFREDLRIGTKALAEDTEFCYRLLGNNEELRYIPEVLLYHPIDRNKLKKDYFKNYAFSHGMIVTKYQKVPSSTRYYFRVPRYYYKSLMINFYRFIIRRLLHSNRAAFFYRLRLNYTLGIIYSYFKGYNKAQIIP